MLLRHCDFDPPVQSKPIDLVRRCMQDATRTLRHSLKEISQLYYMRPQNLLLFEVGCVLVDIPNVAYTILTERDTSFVDRATYLSFLMDLLFTSEKPDTWRREVEVRHGHKSTLRLHGGLIVRGTRKKHHVMLPSVLAGRDMTEQIRQHAVGM